MTNDELEVIVARNHSSYKRLAKELALHRFEYYHHMKQLPGRPIYNYIISKDRILSICVRTPKDEIFFAAFVKNKDN